MKAAGLARVAALALIWGSGFLLIKISLRSFTPVELTFARLALVAAVIAAIYAKVYPEAASSMLPAGNATLINELFLGGASTALEYAVGTPERMAANHAFSQVQKWGGVAATCVLIMAIPGVGLWKNYRLDKKQNKGTVF